MLLQNSCGKELSCGNKGVDFVSTSEWDEVNRASWAGKDRGSKTVESSRGG